MLSNTRPRPRGCTALAGVEASMPNSCCRKFREFKSYSLIGAARLNVQVVNVVEQIRCAAKFFYCQNIVKPTHLCCEIVKEILLSKLRFKSEGGSRCQRSLKSCQTPRTTRAEVICRPVRFARIQWWPPKRQPMSPTTSSAISGRATPAV